VTVLSPRDGVWVEPRTNGQLAAQLNRLVHFEFELADSLRTAVNPGHEIAACPLAAVEAHSHDRASAKR